MKFYTDGSTLNNPGLQVGIYCNLRYMGMGSK